MLGRPKTRSTKPEEAVMAVAILAAIATLPRQKNGNGIRRTLFDALNERGVIRSFDGPHAMPVDQRSVSLFRTATSKPFTLLPGVE